MARRRQLEKSYYEPIRQFLRSRMGCVVESYSKNGSPLPFVGRGLRGLVVDVFGVRGIKETASRALEGLAVEVKRSTKRTSLRHMVQASQYGRIAHRCYLAQPRRFTERNKIEASRFGIGLIQITDKGPTVVSESRQFIPDPDAFEMFLHKPLRIVRCALCSCYLFKYGPNGGIVVRGHWVHDQLSPRDPKKKFNKKMYVCPKCEVLIASIARSAQASESIEIATKRTRRSKRRL